MRVIQSVALSTALVLGALGTAVAEAPTIIVNYKEGGAADRTARGIAESMSRAIDDQVRVENVAGQGGAKGILEFLETGQDGGTLLFAFAPATTSVSIKHPEFQLDSLRIINVQTQDPVLLYTTPDTGWSNLSDMVTSIQGEPGKYVFGSSGPSSAGTVMANQFIESLGLDVKVAAYQGGGKTRKAMLNGEVHFSAAGASAPLAQKDSFVPLGVFWDEADQIWNAPAINDALEAPGVTVPNGAAYRFIAAHGDVSDERFQELVSIVEKATKDEQFIADAEARSIGSSWFGPETSTEILQLADEEFRQMLGAGN